MSSPFGPTPPELSPPPAGPQTGPGGRMARALMDIPLRPKRMAAARANRDAWVQMGAMRLRSIGSDEAEAMAQLLEQNPEASTAFIEQYGGWGQVETMLRASAAAGGAQGFINSLPEGSPQRAYAEWQMELGPEADFGPALSAALRVGESQADRDARARESQADRDVRREGYDVQRDVAQMGAESRVTAAEIAADARRAAAAGKGGPTRQNESDAVEIENARQQFRKLQAKNQWGPAELRRIIARADDMTLSFARNILADKASEEEYAAAQYKLGAKFKTGYPEDRADYEAFVGQPVADLTPEAQQQRELDAARREADAFFGR